MEKTVEYIKTEFERLDDQYWKLFSRAENAKKEYLQAKSIHDTYQSDLNRLKEEKEKFAIMLEEVHKLNKNK